MCGPAAAVALMAVGTTVSAYGTYQQGQDAKAVGNFNAQVANNNAIYAQQLGAYKEERQREVDQYKRGKMATLFMKNGIQIDETSSAAAVLDEQSVQDELEALMIRNGAAAESNRYRNQGALDLAEGNMKARTATTSAAGTLLQGAGQTYFAGSKMGVFK